MLVELSIQDFVLIERAALEPAPDLSVVTGATGDGKTLLLRALRFLLGERASPERTIRRGAPRSVVEGLFRVDDPALRAELRELGAPDDWEGPDLVLSRTLEPGGRGRIRIGGRLASVGELRSVGERLVDVLSQHEYQSLTRPDRQRRVLDAYGRLDQLAQRFTAARTALREAASERDALVRARDDASSREAAQRNELEALRALAPRAGEFEELERERELLANVQAVQRSIEQGCDRLSEREASALDLVRTTVRELEVQAARAPALARVAQSLAAAASELSEAANELARERDRLELDPERLAAVEERLEAYRTLARRLWRGEAAGRRPVGCAGAPRPGTAPGSFGVPPEPRALHERLDQLSRAVQPEGAADERIAALDAGIARAAPELEGLGAQLSEGRSRVAKQLERGVLATLAQLGMAGARLEVAVEPLPRSAACEPGGAEISASIGGRFPSADGLDRVQVRFASSPGTPLLPLAEVASGGELARVCLALKARLAEADDVPLLVFDEVDQNVGGRLGAAIGRVLSSIGRTRQVLAVTHLPSVAAHGTRHFLVEKRLSDGAEAEGRAGVARSVDGPSGDDLRGDEPLARTDVRPLEGDERVRELALMIRGEPVTEAALEQARELLAAGEAGAQGVASLAPAGAHAALDRPRRAGAKASRRRERSDAV